jgi:hypothetical protein
MQSVHVLIFCSRCSSEFSLSCTFILQIEEEKDRTTTSAFAGVVRFGQKYVKSFNLYDRQLLLLLKFMFNFNFFSLCTAMYGNL